MVVPPYKIIAVKEIFAIRCMATTRNANKCRKYASLYLTKYTSTFLLQALFT